jgi:DNA-binding LacI/PurR family transcriptional regulator
MTRRKLNAPTSYDVARHAGVSQAVVSRAFQPVAPISADTRARVLAAAASLGYQPNAMARSLITKRTGLAGVLLTEATLRDTPDLLIVLAQALLEQGFQPLLFPCTHEDDGGTALDNALAFGVDGVVSGVSLSEHDLAKARLRQRPVVLFNRHSTDPDALQVACDHASAAALLAARLYAAGHRRFAVVTGPTDAPVSMLRVDSFLGRLAELGVGPVPSYVGDYHYESGHTAGLQLLGVTSGQAAERRPEVVFCANDAMALGVLDAARFALMLRVPRDVSVVGFDDIPSGQRPAYLLTTVRQPFKEMAVTAARLFRDALDDTPVAQPRVLVPGTLIERGSAQLFPESPSH